MPVTTTPPILRHKQLSAAQLIASFNSILSLFFCSHLMAMQESQEEIVRPDDLFEVMVECCRS